MALLTLIGMGSGLSLAVAKRFAREGFAIAMIARRADRLNQYRAELAEYGVDVQGYAADAGDTSLLKSALDNIRTAMGMPDVLVYNAAAVHNTPALQQSTEGLAEDFRVNVGSAFEAARWALPDMIQRGRGTILLTGGGLALQPAQAYTSLSIGKAGLRSLAFSLAEAVQGTGVHVATVTIAGFINPADAKHNPTLIAEEYWRLHTQTPADFQTEVVY